MGKLVAALKSEGLWDTTLLVFASDNGGPVCVGGSQIRIIWLYCNTIMYCYNAVGGNQLPDAEPMPCSSTIGRPGSAAGSDAGRCQ